MSRRFSIVLIALFALGGGSLASAEEPSPNSTLDPTALARLSEVSLDTAFEDATSPKSDPRIGVLCGPTTMDCHNDKKDVEALETCVVTVDGMLAAMPAALANH